MTSLDPGADDPDRERFEAAFRDHYADVLAYSLRRMGDRGAAEDAAAEAFAVAWRRRGTIPEEPLPWLYGVARRVLANQRRGVERRRRLEERVAGERTAGPGAHEPGGVDPGEALARRSAFTTALARLGDEDREVLRLVAWEGLDPRAAAAVLGCSHGAFRVRLHRARGRLRKQLAAAGHVTDERRDRGADAIEETQ